MTMPVSVVATTVPTESVIARQSRWSRLPGKAKVGVVLMGMFILAAIIGPMVEPYDPGYQNPLPSLSLHAPYGAHLLGTTQTGQDLLSQLLTGIRLTLELGLLVGVIGTVLAVLVGVTAAFLGGVWDELLLLFTNVFLVIPPLPLLIILLGYFSNKGQLPTILVLSVLGWPWGARVIRAQTLAIRGRDFVAAARETGESSWRIITFEIVPNQVSLIAANFVNTMLYAIGASVALAFLGLTNVSSWSLGTTLYWAESQNALQLGAWWWFVPPGLAVALMGTALVLLNSGIDELGNPRLRDASSASRIAGHRVRPTDPTSVLHEPGSDRSRLAAFLHSFSRASLLEAREAEQTTLDRTGLHRKKHQEREGSK
jgi:peptide/nickel transport system permease protein